MLPYTIIPILSSKFDAGTACRVVTDLCRTGHAPTITKRKPAELPDRRARVEAVDSTTATI
jgi:hypothetical protein